jgi:hypothetical protein
MHGNHLPSPGLCKVFELGMDRAHEVELLFASRANVFLTLKVEQALAAIGRSESC